MKFIVVSLYMFKKPSSFFVRLFLIAHLFCVLSLVDSKAQEQFGFVLPEGKKRVEIPFQQYSNLIVIPVTINGFLTLKFILDTGAETSILTEKLFGDVLELNYVREIDLQAPGIEDSLRAFVAAGINFSLPGGIEGKNHNLLVLKDDYLELNKNLGDEIYGIMGYDVFSRFVVSIDYDEQMLTLHDPNYFRPRRSETPLPMQIVDTKPYVKVKVGQKDKFDSLKLMVDTGASHALLLDLNKSNKIQMPRKTVSTRLGKGLAGEIPGQMGRVTSCEMGGLRFEKVLSSFPLEGAYTQGIKRGSRHGTLGAEILTRMKVTFDYHNELMYIRKGADFKKPFEFNMSGIILNAEGKKLDSLVINHVIPNSPGSHSGLRVGDVILRINNMNLSNSTITDLNAVLRKKPGLKMVVIISRGEQKIKKRFRLKRLI
ncbi:MAG: aspartyl protease family protein [Cyclobacteriaceae bacterium]